MNIYLLIWLSLFATLTVLSFRRAVWGFSLYCLTSLIHPSCWWWGDPLGDARVTLAAGVIFLLSSAMHYAPPEATVGREGSAVARRVGRLAVLLFANATFVQLFLALNENASLETYLLQAENLVFFIAAVWSVRDEQDFRIMVLTLVVGLAHFGFQVVLRHEGFMYQGRLEGIGRPGFIGSNGLAMMVIGILPLAGGLLFFARGWQKVLGGFAAATGLEVLVRCNSRGAFLALIAGGVVLLAVSRGAARRRLLAGVALALLAGLVIVNKQVIERFNTTFARAEERDESASSRLVLWAAGLNMLADRPLGAGGRGFKLSELGAKYREGARQAAGVKITVQSVHNGYLAQACDWGLQGLGLKLLLTAVAWIGVWKTMRFRMQARDPQVSLFGGCICASIMCFLVKDVTGDHSMDEMFFWLIAVAACYAKVYAPAGNAADNAAELSAEPVSSEWATAT